MQNQGFVDIQGSYHVAIYAILPLATVYVGTFLAISNHYVLRPKIQSFLERSSISSSMAREFIIDVLSNLSFISYAFSAYFIMEPSDYPIRLLEYYNMHWITICLAIVMYMKIPNTDPIQNIVFIKNGVFLGLCFIDILYHYFIGSTLLSLPAILLGLYLINLILNSNQDKYVQFMYQFLQLKINVALKSWPEIVNKRLSIQYISKNYPVSKIQLDQKLKQQYKKKFNCQNKNNRVRKQQNNQQIDTKIVARKRLLEICLAINISLKKKEEEDRKIVREYIGFMNAPLPQKLNNSKRENIGFRQRKTYYRQKSKQKANKIQYIQGKQAQKISSNKDKKEQVYENTSSNLVEKHNLQPHYEVYDKDQSFLFYLFPVKVFQSTRLISTIFSIGLNIGFGFLLDYCQNVMNTLTYGRFFQFVLAALLLPLIPEVSVNEYANAMALASIWKYGVCGLFQLICIGANQNSQLNGSWKPTNYFQYQTIVQLVILILSYYFIYLTKNRYKVLIVLFFLALAGNVGVTYLSIRSYL